MSEEAKIVLPRTDEAKTIPYMKYKEFFRLYPFEKDERISMGKNFVVKKLEAINGVEFATELNAYNMLDHPCILKPLAWTFKENFGYLASPRAKNIIEAYNDGDITIEEILSDILSVVAFINKNGYVYGDTKPGNILFHEGKAKLIDFGRFTKAVLNKDGQYYVRGTLYTSVYMDPEYAEEYYNNIKCEIYPIASSCKEIIENEIPCFGDVYGYKSGKKNMDKFFAEATITVEERKDINEILEESQKNLIVRTYEAKINVPPFVLAKKDKRFVILMSWLGTVAFTYGIDSEALFLGYHIIYRLYTDYKNTFEDRKKFNSYLQIFGSICLDLAMAVVSYETLTLEEWKDISDEKDNNLYNRKYVKTYIKILKLSGGLLISPTWWDYSESAEQVESLFFRMIEGGYNPYLIKDKGGNSNKYVGFNKVILESEKERLDNKDYPKLRSPTSTGDIPKIMPSKIKLKYSSEVIVHFWSKDIHLDDSNIHIFLPTVLHNRDILMQLDKDISIKIYVSLIRLSKDPDYSKMARVFISRMPSEWLLKMQKRRK